MKSLLCVALIALLSACSSPKDKAVAVYKACAPDGQVTIQYTQAFFGLVEVFSVSCTDTYEPPKEGQP